MLHHSVVSDSATPWAVVPGSPVHGILQARVLEWVAVSFSHGPGAKPVSSLRAPLPLKCGIGDALVARACVPRAHGRPRALDPGAGHPAAGSRPPTALCPLPEGHAGITGSCSVVISQPKPCRFHDSLSYILISTEKRSADLLKINPPQRLLWSRESTEAAVWGRLGRQVGVQRRSGEVAPTASRDGVGKWPPRPGQRGRAERPPRSVRV